MTTYKIWYWIQYTNVLIDLGQILDINGTLRTLPTYTIKGEGRESGRRRATWVQRR